MFGTGIAFHTAFLVFGASRLFGYYLRGPLALLPWILPPLIGGLAARWYIASLKRRLDEATTNTADPDEP